MSTLSLSDLTDTDHLIYPEEFQDVGPHSPALALFTDFRRHEPLVIDGWMSAVEAAPFMRASHTRLRLVVDHRGEFIGTVTLDDLSELQLIRKVAAGETRYSIRVVDLMRHRRELRALCHQDLVRSTVQDVLDTLRDHREQHCLVVDTGDHCIRGLIAASDVARRLHIDVRLNELPTFASLCVALRHR